MRKAFRASGLVALTAMLGSMATPALAGRGWYGGGHSGWSHHHRHRGHDDGFGAFLGAAAVIGAVAILASSKNKKANAEQAHDEPPPEDRRYDDGAEAIDQSPEADNAETASEAVAVDACAVAAEDEAARDGDEAEVTDITGTHPIDGGWTVDGTLEQRGGQRSENRSRAFNCTWRDGRVADVVLDREDVARL